MEDMPIRLSADERVCQFVDIMVADIPKAYGLILSRDWSVKLDGYFATYWSHLWLPYQGCKNHIKVMREPHMRHNVTQLEGKNEPINFSHPLLGNYFIDLEMGNYQAEESDNRSDTQPDLLHFSWADKVDCNIVSLVLDVESSNSLVDLENKFWVLYFDG